MIAECKICHNVEHIHAKGRCMACYRKLQLQRLKRKSYWVERAEALEHLMDKVKRL